MDKRDYTNRFLDLIQFRISKLFCPFVGWNKNVIKYMPESEDFVRTLDKPTAFIDINYSESKGNTVGSRTIMLPMEMLIVYPIIKLDNNYVDRNRKIISRDCSYMETFLQWLNKYSEYAFDSKLKQTIEDYDCFDSIDEITHSIRRMNKKTVGHRLAVEFGAVFNLIIDYPELKGDSVLIESAPYETRAMYVNPDGTITADRPITVYFYQNRPVYTPDGDNLYYPVLITESDSYEENNQFYNNLKLINGPYSVPINWDEGSINWITMADLDDMPMFEERLGLSWNPTRSVTLDIERVFSDDPLVSVNH